MCKAEGLDTPFDTVKPNHGVRCSRSWELKLRISRGKRKFPSINLGAVLTIVFFVFSSKKLIFLRFSAQVIFRFCDFEVLRGFLGYF